MFAPSTKARSFACAAFGTNIQTDFEAVVRESWKLRFEPFRPPMVSPGNSWSLLVTKKSFRAGQLLKKALAEEDFVAEIVFGLRRWGLFGAWANGGGSYRTNMRQH